MLLIEQLAAKVQLGSTVAVVGLGGICLSALLGAIAAGAREVIAININEKSLSRQNPLERQPYLIQEMRMWWSK